MAVEPGTRLRVMLVDDHEIVRSGIKAMLAGTDDIRVVAEAESVAPAVREAERTRPDEVLMLTSFDDDEALYASIMAGAAGYVLKQIRGGDLVRGIRTVGADQSLLDPVVTRQVLDRLRRGKQLQDEKLALLSPREEKILAMVAEGKTNGQIGAELYLAEKTVKNYVSSILGKLEVVRRSEAAAYLARHTSTPGNL